MNKDIITRNLQIIKQKMMDLNIKGSDAISMADILVGIDQTIQIVNAPEPTEQEESNEN